MTTPFADIGPALNDLIDTAYSHLMERPSPIVRNLWQAFLGCLEEASQCYWHIRLVTSPEEQPLYDQAQELEELKAPF